MTLYEQVVEVLIQRLGEKHRLKITPESCLEKDLEADSLDKVELVMTLEEVTGLAISDERAAKLVTVQDIVSFLEHNGVVEMR